MAVNGGAQQCFISHVLLMIDIVYDVMTDFLSLLHYKLVDRQDRLRILNQRAESRESDRVLAAVSVINQHVSILVCWPSKTSADKTKKKKWVNRTIIINMIKEVPYSWLKGECYGFFFFVIGNKEMYVQMGNIW